MTMETLNPTLPIPISDQEFRSIIEAAPQALEINTEITRKAIASGESILSFVDNNGMSDEVDTKINAYQVKVKERLQEMYDRRTPLTKLFDKVKSAFTEQENQLSPKNSDSIYSKLQKKRDEFATQKENKRKAREAEISRKQEIEKAKIDLLGEAKVDLDRQFGRFLEEAKRDILDYFNAITIENAEFQKDCINSFSEVYRKEIFREISIDIHQNPLLKWEETMAIKEDAKVGKYEEYAYVFKTTIANFKAEMLQQVPGKVKYLQDLKAADTESKKRMEEQEKRRKEEQDARLAKEREDAEKAAAAKAEAEKQNAITEQAFNNVTEVLENTSGSGAVESYEINVLKPAGWVLIFQKWFEKEGITKDNATIEKKSLRQMKAFCEKLYKSSSEKIESPFLEYIPTYKVRAKK